MAEGQQTKPMIGNHEAGGVRDRLGNPQPFFPRALPSANMPELGMAPGKLGTGGHGGQDDLAEALVGPHPVEGRHVCLRQSTACR